MTAEDPAHRTGFPLCPLCERPSLDIKRRQLNTSYVDDELNWQTSCGRCWKDAVDHYDEMWRDYYRSRL